MPNVVFDPLVIMVPPLVTVLLEITVPLVIGAADTTVPLEFGVQIWPVVLLGPGTTVLLWQLQPGAGAATGAGVTVVVGM